MKPLSYVTAYLLPEVHEEQRWLIEDLWAAQAVGIIGGEPKYGKSFLALTLAVAVASGQPALGRFRVGGKGAVLLYAAEDALQAVRERLTNTARAHGLSLESLDIRVITEPHVRLDSDLDVGRLSATMSELSPSLLILDPFVRLHSVDENSSGEVAAILAKLRTLQRAYHCAIMVVHHSKKGGLSLRAGQALRGSSEFHAWGDSNLYLRRLSAHELVMGVEHRQARSIPDVPLRLVTDENGAHLDLVCESERASQRQKAHEQAIVAVLAATGTPLRLRELRQKTNLKTERVSHTLRELVATGRVVHTPDGYRLP